MRFIKVSSPKRGIDFLVKALAESLEDNRKTTWIVSGGSNIAISQTVLRLLPIDKLGLLSVLLGDERYGKFNHKDSNYAQLIDAGFNPEEINFRAVLSKNNKSIEWVAAHYDSYVREVFAKSDSIIGQFGIGVDGHTVGVLPNSPASKEYDKFVANYEGPDYGRITLTFEALKMIDQAYVYAFGENKTTALRNLRDQEISLEIQPAQIFRQFIEESFIINNVIGEI